MEIVGLIIFGAVIGVLARLFMRGEQPIGVLWTVILGILGALAGYFITGLFGYTNANGGIAWLRDIVSVVAAMVFISVYMGIRSRASVTR